MTRDVLTVTPDTTLPDAHALMTAKRIRRLPVTDGGRLVGIVTLGDVRGAEPSAASSLSVWEMKNLLVHLTVEEFMTRDPVTINENAAIGDAAQLMLERKFSGLPVVDDSGALVGILTESDIFRLVAREWSQAP
jgi:acetoin utilization protein AcuB